MIKPSVLFTSLSCLDQRKSAHQKSHRPHPPHEDALLGVILPVFMPPDYVDHTPVFTGQEFTPMSSSYLGEE